MKNKLFSILLALGLCISASAGITVGAAETALTVLAEYNYANGVNTGGINIGTNTPGEYLINNETVKAVKVPYPGASAINYNFSSTNDTHHKIEVIQMVLTPMNTTLHNVIQASYPDPSTAVTKFDNLVAFTNTGYCSVLNSFDAGKSFQYTAGNTYAVEATMNLHDKLMNVTVTDVTSGGSVVKLNAANLPIGFDYLNRYKINFENGSNGEITYVHSIKISEAIADRISLYAYGTNMPPYTEGDNILIKAVPIGQGVPQSVSLYNGRTLLGTVSSVPFEWTLPDAEAGTYRLYAVADYGNGKQDKTELNVEVKKYAYGTPLVDVPCENGSFIDQAVMGGTTSSFSYAPMPGVTDQGNALYIRPRTDSDSNINREFTAELTASRYVVWKCDLMTTTSVVTEGTDVTEGQRGFELKYKNNENNIVNSPLIFKMRKDGQLTLNGTSMTIPYSANTLYRVGVIFDMQQGVYHITISDPNGLVYSGYNLSWATAGTVKAITRVKFQQNKGISTNNFGMYLDNLYLNTLTETDRFLDSILVQKGSTTIRALSNIHQGDSFTCTPYVKNNKASFTASVIVAVYDNAGRLVQAGVQNDKAFDSGLSVSSPITITATEDFQDNYKVKAFVWENLQTLKNMTGAKSY